VKPSVTEIPRNIATQIKMVVIDVDGVLTDGGIYMGVTPAGEFFELKRFEITDGLGIKMLGWAGLLVYVVSGRHSPANFERARDLDVPYREAHGGYKLAVVEDLVREHNLSLAEVCCICDDLADLPIVQRAGLPVAVANAVAEVKAAALWETTRKGGNGAVRELAEALLKSRGDWDRLVEEYCRKHGGPAPADATSWG
jgi:3-deoxy-D-manno-octulosonate 8-phosphate phosphatase (KDO 8-P phosphatase)